MRHCGKRSRAQAVWMPPKRSAPSGEAATATAATAAIAAAREQPGGHGHCCRKHGRCLVCRGYCQHLRHRHGRKRALRARMLPGRLPPLGIPAATATVDMVAAAVNLHGRCHSRDFGKPSQPQSRPPQYTCNPWPPRHVAASLCQVSATTSPHGYRPRGASISATLSKAVGRAPPSQDVHLR